jgi:acetyl-CoA carboxylase biotin carboxyl carrier protein
MAEEVRAPLDGTIHAVLIEPGTAVQADDELVVIEALKMENLVYAPCAGNVSDVRVRVGDKVNAGDLMLLID